MSALPAAMAAVAAAMQGFSTLFTSNHASHYQSDNTRQNRKYHDCSHTFASFFQKSAFISLLLLPAFSYLPAMYCFPDKA